MPAPADQERGVATAGYRCYAGSQAVSIVGTMMTYTALYWLTLHIARGNAAVLSALVAAQFLPMLLFSRRAGAIVAGHRPARVLVATQAAQAAGSLALGVPLLAGWMAVWYLWVLSFVVGCVLAVDVPARQLFMRDLVGDAELRRGSALYAAITGLAKIAGPGVAGIIIAVSGEAAVFLTDAASFSLVIGVLTWLAREVRLGEKAERASAWPARRFRWVLELPRGIQVAAGMALLVGGFGIQFEVTNPLMATKVFHLGSLGFGLIGTFTAAGGIAGNFYSSHRNDPGYREFLAWAALFGAAELAAAVMPVAWAYDVLMVVVGAAIQLFAVSATVYVQKNAPQTQRGHALSAYNAGFMGFVPAGAFVVAGLAAFAGTRWALIIPGVVILACGTALLARELDRSITTSYDLTYGEAGTGLRWAGAIRRARRPGAARAERRA
ncbi:MAG TPA: MFS transporter [Streptosporangiaceae bacterium]|nr:MFS transporter [Streptosporangiaceae bacterium]